MPKFLQGAFHRSTPAVGQLLTLFEAGNPGVFCSFPVSLRILLQPGESAGNGDAGQGFRRRQAASVDPVNFQAEIATIDGETVEFEVCELSDGKAGLNVDQDDTHDTGGLVVSDAG